MGFRLVNLMDMNGIDDDGGKQSASTGHRFSCFVGTLSVVQNLTHLSIWIRVFVAVVSTF